MENVRELLRLPAPAPQPQALAFDGTSLWLGSRETNQVFSIDPASWVAREETIAPGKPYGMTVVGDELRVLCALPPNDDRTIFRFVPGHGFKTEGAIAAPDDAGSYLSYDGDRLYMSQWYTKRIIALDDTGVTFRWKDYHLEGRARFRLMTLAVHEFIRRFLIHILPRGLHRIRHYGLFANTGRADNIARARELLGVPKPQSDAPDADTLEQTDAFCTSPFIVVPNVRLKRPSALKNADMTFSRSARLGSARRPQPCSNRPPSPIPATRRCSRRGAGR